MSQLRDLAKLQSSVPPPGLEYLSDIWGKLTPVERVVVVTFANALREVRLMETDLLRLGTVDHVRGLLAETRRHLQLMREARRA